MRPSAEQRALRVLSGQQHGVGPSLARAALSLVEPFYATIMRTRNALYDREVLRSHDLGRPTISIGNITAGGTGKTPMVRWLAERLIERGHRPAILMRGYGADASGGNDEQRMLANHFGDRASIIANPNRVAGAAAAMSHAPAPDLFILDDGFQHRRAQRDFDLVLISATDPFGYGHVHPRGLLREPLCGLGRADAIVITRSNQVDAQRLAEIEQIVRRYADVPIYRASHALIRLGGYRGSESLDALANVRAFAFCGIADPVSFERQLKSAGVELLGSRWFPDHRRYIERDVAQVLDAARALGAEIVLTTEKDWVKLAALPGAGDASPPIVRVEMEIQFTSDHEHRLLEQIAQRVKAPAARAEQRQPVESSQVE